MRRTVRLRWLVLIVLAARGYGASNTFAASAWQTAHAHHHGLALLLRLKTAGSTVVARATLTNDGQQPFRYRGGCAPPIVQIQSNDAAGHDIYGWMPTGVRCGAIVLLTLAPGASVHVHVRFAIRGSGDVRALVPSTVDSKPLVQTRSIAVSPAAALLPQIRS
jgi:hypothetical protein